MKICCRSPMQSDLPSSVANEPRRKFQTGEVAWLPSRSSVCYRPEAGIGTKPAVSCAVVRSKEDTNKRSLLMSV